jgi:hypothetical protein
MKRVSKWAISMTALAMLLVSSCKDKDCPVPNKELTGKWERVDGNNSPFNGMVVSFSETKGVLEVVPGTAIGFKVSDAKWKNVLDQQNGVFTLEDLDSGGGYIKSRILILAEGKEMMLSGTGSTVGNYQLWKKI